MKIKRGVNLNGLKCTMGKPIQFLSVLYRSYGVELVITDAVRAPKDGEKSLHPMGHAIDIRTRDLNHLQKASVNLLLTLYLGNDYDVIEYDSHLHIEYQRQIDDNVSINFISLLGQDKFEEVG